MARLSLRTLRVLAVAGILAGTPLILSAGAIGGSVKPISFPAYADRVTRGPDGNVWILDRKQNLVGRVTPAGQFTAFPIPTPNSQPEYICAGSDGNLWFTEAGTQKIGRITTAGVITEFKVAVSPFDIIDGPDGNRWFNDAVGNVSKITEDGFVQVFHLGSNGPYHMGAFGPDGNLWYMSSPLNAAIRMTPAGVTTVFPLPAPNTNYYGFFLVAGPDGNLWATHANNIARITTSGVITDYTIPTANADPSGITVGADGNIWFTEYGSGNVGQLILSTATASGQATIDEDPVGSGLATIFPLGAAWTSAAAASTRPEAEARTDSSSCKSGFLVQQDAGLSSGNLLLYSTPPAPKCADLDSQFIGIECKFSREGPLVCTYTVFNQGPDVAESVEIEPVIGSIFGVTSCTPSCGGKCGDTCSVPEIAPFKSYVITYTFGLGSDYASSFGAFSAQLSASSATKDPDATNNSTKESFLIPFGLEIVNTTTPPPTTPPSKRGGP